MGLQARKEQGPVIKQIASRFNYQKELMKYSKFSFKVLPFVTLLFFLFSCNNSKQIRFDKNKWSEQTDPLFPSPNRPKMLTDLTTNYNLVGLQYFQVIELLGIPDSKDSGSLSYKIVVNYGHGIDPIYTKNLDFTFSKDSTITSFKVDEWKKK